MELHHYGVRITTDSSGAGSAVMDIPTGRLRMLAVHCADPTVSAAITTVAIATASPDALNGSNPYSQSVLSSSTVALDTLTSINAFTINGTATITLTGAAHSKVYHVDYWLAPGAVHEAVVKTDSSGAATFNMPVHGGVFEQYMVEYADAGSASDSSFGGVWSNKTVLRGYTKASLVSATITGSALTSAGAVVVPPGTLTLALTLAEHSKLYRVHAWFS